MNQMNTPAKIHFYSDSSLWALILSNLVIIAWALLEGWSLAPLMWIYWCQSAIIGFFWFFKMWGLKEFSTKNFQINDRNVPPTPETKRQTAIFFACHYGFFHLGYLVFLIGGSEDGSFLSEADGDVSFLPILIAAGIFFAYQCYSHFYNQKWLVETKPNIGTMMFFPYARIVPMHFTIIFGGTEWGQQQPLALFLFLKLLADAIMHIVERRGFADKKK